MLIVIILGGIYGGIFTPTEAAAVAAVYAFSIAVFVYRDIGMKDVPRVLVDSGKVTVMLMFIIANALLFAHVLTTERIPQVDRRDDRRLGHAGVAVPDRRQRAAADRRHVHGADRDHPDHGADPVPDRAAGSASIRSISASSWSSTSRSAW